jgi:hypothetical protein
MQLSEHSQCYKNKICIYEHPHIVSVPTTFNSLCNIKYNSSLYSASHLRVAPENDGLQKEQKCNTFACHTCNEVQLCFGNSQKGSW